MGAINVGDGFVELGLDNKEFNSKLDAAGKKFTGKLDKWKRGMKIAGGVIAGAAIGIGTVSIKMAADFDGAMREVNTMMLLNQEEFEALSADVRELSADMGVNAVDSAHALYQAISAGVPKENAIDFLRVATKAAIGGVTDTETAVDGLTTVMNAFKIPVEDAEHVADLMFTTIKGGKTTFDELSASMFQVAPLAASAGIEFSEISAALATMTKQGVPTSVATTQLKEAIKGITAPGEAMRAIIQELGYESGQAMVEEEGFAGALGLVGDVAGGSQDKLKEMFGSVEGMSAVLALTGDNAQMFADDLLAMEDAAGASTAAFDEMEKTTGRQFEKMKSQFADVAMSIGINLLPVLTTLLDAVKPIVETVGAWVKEHPKLTTAILAGMVAFGGLLMLIGPILTLVSGISAALPILGVAFAALTGPVGLIILAITGLVAAGVAIYKNWDWIKAKASQIWAGIQVFFKIVTKKLVDLFMNMTPIGFIIDNWELISSTAGKIFGGLKKFIGWIGEGIKQIFMNMTPIGFIINNWELISDVATRIFGGIVKFFQGIPTKIKSAFRSLADIMLAPFRLYVEGLERAINWIIRQINKISIKMPSWLPPPLGGKSFGFDIPTISLPKFAKGGMINEPTLLYGLRSKRPYAIAGEAGPEAVVPGGGGGGEVSINMYGPWNVRSSEDISGIGEAVGIELRKILDRKANLRGATI